MKASRIFYDNFEKKGGASVKPQGILGFLYLLLKKYEYHRTDAAIDFLPKRKSILDLGCGNGEFLIKAKKFGFRRLFGLDISKEVIKSAKKHILRVEGANRNFSLVVGDLDDKLPFKVSSFDVVVCLAVLEHIYDPHHSISEIARVLRQSGTLIIEVPNIAWMPRRFSLLFGNFPATSDARGWDGGHLHYFTQKSLTDLLTKEAFEIEAARCTGIFAKVRNLWPSLLGGDIIIKAKKK